MLVDFSRKIMSENLQTAADQIFAVLDQHQVFDQLNNRPDGTAFRQNIMPGIGYTFAPISRETTAVEPTNPVLALMGAANRHPAQTKNEQQTEFLGILVTYNLRSSQLEVHTGISTGGPVMISQGGKYFVPTTPAALPRAIEQAIAYAHEQRTGGV